MNDSEKLTYFIAEKNNIVVISLIGPLLRGNAHVLEACMDEISRRHVRFVIVNFRDVPNTMDRTVIPALARLQRLIRSKPAVLRMSSIHPELRRTLETQGILRPEELANNLSDALKSLVVDANAA
ncbi:MAG: hypothetical protein A2428_12135 [Bdellovibrionales bacterium RIFOXYC1_FULL_54_43]|nr:MAG: hypothetical protein A2428_12135 [Bdellovibrionales bacterium RIFOXYC1_FULL_54_43]OFZ84332.1 MAG: hypothetical protein A2603_07445 [Bdellovibrionales bacterium RIFOXYD1_FULL_55_31]